MKSATLQAPQTPATLRKGDGGGVSRLEWLALIAILVLAAALRMGAPGITEFKRDEANLSQLALDMARGRNFPLLGIGSSVGIPNAPISVYLFAIPYFLSGDPTLATLFVGLLNVVGVGMTWAVARRYYGPTAALIAALLYAVSPWGVIYSRKIWAQDLLPPFVIATVASGLLGFVEGKRWAQVVHLPLLAITLQIHYGAFVLIPVSALLFVLGRRRLTRAFVWSVAVLILLMLPFAFGLIRAGMAHLDQVGKVLAADSGSHPILISGEALHLAALTVAGTEIHSLAGETAFRQYLASVPDAYPLFNLIVWAVVLAAVWLAVRGVRSRDARAPVDLSIVAWLAIPPLAFTVTWTVPFPHYMIPMMPAAYIVLGAGVGRVLGWAGNLTPRPPSLSTEIRKQRGGVKSFFVSSYVSPLAPLKSGGEGSADTTLIKSRVFRVGVIAGILIVAALQVWLTVALFGFLDTHDTPGGFGTPLHALLDVRSAILAEHPGDVLVIGEGDIAPYNETPAVWRVLLDGLPSVRFVNANRMMVVPDHAALYVGDRSSQDTIGRVPVSAPQLFPTRPAASPLAIWHLSQEAAQKFSQLDGAVNTANSRLSNGVTLQRVEFVEHGSTLVVREWWRIERTASDPNVLYSVFNHVVEGDSNAANEGKKWGQIDGPFWLGHYWRAGDIVLQEYTIPLSDGHPPLAQLSLRTGMYTFDGTNFYGVDVLDKNGVPAGQGVVVPIVALTVDRAVPPKFP